MKQGFKFLFIIFLAGIATLEIGSCNSKIKAKPKIIYERTYIQVIDVYGNPWFYPATRAYVDSNRFETDTATLTVKSAHVLDILYVVIFNGDTINGPDKKPLKTAKGMDSIGPKKIVQIPKRNFIQDFRK